jgi:[CysO sulfur-carrier protein]-S-L-cysteine hydrolase
MVDRQWTMDNGTPVLPARQAIFRLSVEIAAQIIEHAREGYPEEVCGLVAGRGDAAIAVYPGRNISPTPANTYELDHDTLARVFDFEGAGLELVAIYHSHPRGPEVPSPTDVAYAFYPDSVYLIVSLTTPDQPVIKGFRITDRRAREVAIMVDNDEDAWSVRGGTDEQGASLGGNAQGRVHSDFGQ